MSTATAPVSNGTELAKQQAGQVAVAPQKKLSDFLGKPGVIAELKRAAPEHLNPDRLVRLALTAAVKNPKLLECTPESVYLSLLNAAETGLEPNGYDAYLIPYSNKKKIGNREIWVEEAQFQADYKGLVKLAYQSAMVKSCMAMGVYERDHFRYRLGTNAFVEHIPSDEDDRGALKYAYAICELENGGSPFVVLNRSQVMAHKKKSKSAYYKDGNPNKSSPWNNPDQEEAMWAKTAFRVLAKFIPRSPQLQKAISREDTDSLSGAGASQILDISPVVPTRLVEHSRSDELAERLGGGDEQDDRSNADGAVGGNMSDDAGSDDPLYGLEQQLAACTDQASVMALRQQWDEGLDSVARARLDEKCNARREQIAAAAKKPGGKKDTLV